MTTPILYSFRRCPYAIRARLAIARSEIQVELREIALREKPEEMRRISPKGTVPVLILADGEVIDESIEIMHWALRQNDPDNWLPEAGQYPLVKQLVADNDNQFKPLLDRYKYADRFPDYSQNHYRQECGVFLSNLENHLAKHDFLTSDQINIADMAVFPFIRQFASVDKVWFDQSGYIQLKKWLDKLLVLKGFSQIMVKVKPWKAGDNPLLFPA